MSIFSHVARSKVGSNTFDLSHDRKQSMDFGTLTPILVLDTFPGDVIRCQTSIMARFAPMLAPIMHRVNIYTHFFFVPNRLVWFNWEDFITGGEDGTAAPAFPYIDITTGGLGLGELPDYLGIPSGTPLTAQQISAIPFAAYQMIYNEYYRDQNLVTAVADKLINGNNNGTFIPLTTLRTRAWHHDYFTSALPFTQKGPIATIPLGTTAPVIFDTTLNQGGIIRKASDNLTENTNAALTTAGGVGNLSGGSTPNSVFYDPNNTLITDLSTATAATINDLRQAFRLQEWLEKNARGGSRYIESILSHFDVRSPDARLQRPEYLGGGQTPIQISEVLQTSSNTTEPTPLATQAGHGIAVGQNNTFKYRCVEHGYVIGIMSVMPKTAYSQGFPKHFLKFDKFDYPWPSFANLGEQPIENRELWIQNNSTDLDTFGYIPRYAEYKYLNSSVHGEFRDTLDFWHWGRIFASQPALNQTFIECVPGDRIFAVPGTEKLYVHVFHNLKATRKLPYFGTPRI